MTGSWVLNDRGYCFGKPWVVERASKNLLLIITCPATPQQRDQSLLHQSLAHRLRAQPGTSNLEPHGVEHVFWNRAWRDVGHDGGSEQIKQIQCSMIRSGQGTAEHERIVRAAAGCELY